MILMIEGIDFSDNVLAGSYEVNSTDVSEEWQNGWHQTVRKVIRQRVEGEFKMLFYKKEQYQKFIDVLKNKKRQGGFYNCVVAVNNRDELAYSEFFIECNLVRNLNGDGTTSFDDFKVSIMER